MCNGVPSIKTGFENPLKTRSIVRVFRFDLRLAPSPSEMQTRIIPGLLLVAFLFMKSTALGHTPVEFLEVIEGKPSLLIEHGVEVQGLLDKQKSETDLEGPYLFSIAIGCMDREVKKQKAYLSWYKIVGGQQERQRKVNVVDLVSGAKSGLTIGSAEYFLSPAQRITSGPPSEVPDGLDHYKAYRIVDSASREIEVTVTDSVVKGQRIIGKPIFLCTAAEEWHHDEHFSASHPFSCFVVYELNPKECDENFSLIDQFGLNQIAGKKSRWLCVRGMLSTDGVK